MCTWPTERAALMTWLPRFFYGFVEHTERVSPICLMHFECHRYSVRLTRAPRDGLPALSAR